MGVDELTESFGALRTTRRPNGVITTTAKPTRRAEVYTTTPVPRRARPGPPSGGGGGGGGASLVVTFIFFLFFHIPRFVCSARVPVVFVPPNDYHHRRHRHRHHHRHYHRSETTITLTRCTERSAIGRGLLRRHGKHARKGRRAWNYSAASTVFSAGRTRKYALPVSHQKSAQNLFNFFFFLHVARLLIIYYHLDFRTARTAKC